MLVTQKILGDVQGAQPHNLSGGKGGALKSVQVRCHDLPPAPVEQEGVGGEVWVLYIY